MMTNLGPARAFLYPPFDVQAQFGITRVDRCGWCKSVCSKGRGDSQLPPRGAAGRMCLAWLQGGLVWLV